MQDKYKNMSLNDFAKIYNLKEATVMKNIEHIPGAIVNNGVYEFIQGSRYPCNIRNSKLNNLNKRRILQKATDEGGYIDHKILRMQEPSFDNMLIELVKCDVICENESKNPYGANKYDVSLSYERLKKLRKMRLITGFLMEI